jgi:hypothetical protein
MRVMVKELIRKELFQIIIVGIIIAVIILWISIFNKLWLEKLCTCGRNGHSPLSYPASYVCALLEECFRENPGLCEKDIPLKTQRAFWCLATEPGKTQAPGIFLPANIKRTKRETQRFCIGWVQHPPCLPEKVAIIYLGNNSHPYSLDLGDDLRAWYVACIVQQINPYVKPDFFKY